MTIRTGGKSLSETIRTRLKIDQISQIVIEKNLYDMKTIPQRKSNPKAQIGRPHQRIVASASRRISINYKQHFVLRPLSDSNIYPSHILEK
jgi:hypothetical protein